MHLCLKVINTAYCIKLDQIVLSLISDGTDEQLFNAYMIKKLIGHKSWKNGSKFCATLHNLINAGSQLNARPG